MVSIDDRLVAFRRSYNGVLAHDIGPDDTDLTFDPPAFDESFRSSPYVARIEFIAPGEEHFEIIWNGPNGIERGKCGTPAREWAEGTKVKIIGVAAPRYGPSDPPTPEEAAIDEEVRRMR